MSMGEVGMSEIMHFMSTRQQALFCLCKMLNHRSYWEFGV